MGVAGRLKARVGRVARATPVAGALLVGPLPFVAAARHRMDSLPTATLLCVYRRANAEHVGRLVLAARKAGYQVRLWALDETAPGLERETVGLGPGTRFALLNKLAHGADPGWLVLTDDDVRFVTPAAPRTLLAVASAHGFDISQPAQGRGSYRSHLITKQRILLSARETTFVEIGPVVAFSPRARALALPFPEEGMGWGVELEWAALRKRGLRMAILDCVPLLHLVPMGGTYEVQLELQDLEQRVRKHGFASIDEAQQTLIAHRFA